MPDSTPSFSEILSVRPDSNVATGNPGVVFNNMPLVKELNDAAQYKAENDWRKYNTFLSNVKDTYKDLAEINKMDTLDEDKPALKKKAAEALSMIAKNPREFFSTGGANPELQKAMGELQQMATMSKQDSLFDFAHRQYLYHNPDLDTDENKAKIQSFRSQPMGKREHYILDLPGLFDPAKLGEQINKMVKKDETGTEVTPDNQFIKSWQATTYDPQKYRAVAESMYNIPDARGRVLSETLKKRFEQLPVDVKNHYASEKDPVKAWYLDLQDAYRMQDQERKEDLKANPNYVNPQELAIKKGELAVKWADHNLRKDKLAMLDKDDKIGAYSVINEAGSILKNGQDVGGGVVQISEPSVVKLFSDLKKDWLGKEKPASSIEYDKNKNQILLVYPTDTDGKTEKVALDQRAWLKEITKRSFPNKDIGTINTIVDEALTNHKNSLWDLTQSVDDANVDDGKIDIKKFTPVKTDKGTFYVDPKTKAVYDGNGKEIK